MEPTVPLTGAQTNHPNDTTSSVPEIEYSAAAKQYINFRRQRMIAARDSRDMAHDEMDGMTFLKWYDVMKKADDQYVAPRRNKTDTSINTGTIRDKDTTLVEYANKYDFEPVAQVFDDNDNMMDTLATTAEDMVRKSKLIEQYKDKVKLTYRSMITFGTALVEETWVERWILQKTLKNGFKVGMDSTAAEWEQKLVKQYDGCIAKLWDLRKCYFGDIRKYFMNGPNGQPYFFTVEYESYDVVKQIYQNWDRWINVPTTVVYTPELTAVSTYSSWWTLRPISLNFCEVVKYYDPIANEFAITINGVDMLPIMEKKTKDLDGKEKTEISGFPLTEVSASGAIPFAKFDLEPMHDFAYSKGQPAKMRVWGDVENMYVKIMLKLMKQKSDPPMGNMGGRNFGPEILDPGTINNEIRDGDLFPILPNNAGATPSDMSFYQLIKKELSKNSVEDEFQGITPGDPVEKTATQEMNEMNAQSLKVAALFDGIISGENQLNWLRTFNIIKNWTKPIDKQIDVERKGITDVYRTITMPTEIDGGQSATKKIIFSKDTSMSSQDVHQKEIHIKKRTSNKDSKIHPVLDKIENDGSETRITVIHPEQLVGLKLSWFYTCVPVPNGSDPLAYMMFSKQINDATTFFGPQSLNVKKLKHKFASITGNDFDTWFLDEQALKQQAQTTEQNGQGTPGSPPQINMPGKPTQAGAVSSTIRAGAPAMMR